MRSRISLRSVYDIAKEDVSCFFMQNKETMVRSFRDCLEDVKNGKGKKPGFLRDGFSIYEYAEDDEKTMWKGVNCYSMTELFPELDGNED